MHRFSRCFFSSFSHWLVRVDRKSLIRCAQRLWRGGIQQDFAAGNATVISCSCVLVLTRSARMTCRVAMRASRCHFNHAIIDPNFPCVYILAATLPFAALRLHALIPHTHRPFLIQIPHILECARRWGRMKKSAIHRECSTAQQATSLKQRPPHITHLASAVACCK